MLEFADNNNKSAFAKLFAFFATESFYPCIRFDIVDFSDNSTCKQIIKRKVLYVSRNMKIYLDFTKKVKAVAEKSYIKPADKHQ